jgi:hypothetical protein
MANRARQCIARIQRDTTRTCGCCDRARRRTSVEMFTHSPEKSGLRSVSGPSGDPAECGELLMLVYRRTVPQGVVSSAIRYLLLFNGCFHHNAGPSTASGAHTCNLRIASIVASAAAVCLWEGWARVTRHHGVRRHAIPRLPGGGARHGRGRHAAAGVHQACRSRAGVLPSPWHLTARRLTARRMHRCSFQCTCIVYGWVRLNTWARVAVTVGDRSDGTRRWSARCCRPLPRTPARSPHASSSPSSTPCRTCRCYSPLLCAIPPRNPSFVAAVADGVCTTWYAAWNSL